MKDLNATVGVFDTHDVAIEAVKELNKGGFPMQKVSIIGKELEKIEDVQGYYTWKEPAKTGAGIGAFWGSIFGILVGVGFVVIPGIGGVFIAGSLAAVVLGGLEGAAVGSIGGGLFGALLGLGVGKDKVLKYQQNLEAGKYLVVAHGTADEVNKAKEILEGVNSMDVSVHV
jgi:hypothetical protein